MKGYKKIIFIITFTLIAVLATIGAIYLKTNSTQKGDINKIIVADKQEEKQEEVVVKGIKYYDTYNENALKIEEKTITDNIRYVQISGLKDEILENKINKEIKEKAEEYQKKNAKNKDKYFHAEIEANYSNVLSVSISQTSDKEDFLVYGLNYNLINGEKLTFDELFTSKSKAISCLRGGLYESIAWNYWNTDEYEETFDISKVNYGDIEDSIYNVIIRYNNSAINNFYFSGTYICLEYEDGKTALIYMDDYKDAIAIYNRYADESANILYKDPSIARKNLYVLTYREKMEYEIREEKENYYIDFGLKISTYDEDGEKKELNNIEQGIMEKAKELIDEKYKEISKLNIEDDEFYLVSYSIRLYKENNDNGCTYSLDGLCNEYRMKKDIWDNNVKENLMKSWTSKPSGEILYSNYIYPMTGIDDVDKKIKENNESIYIEYDKKGNEIVLKEKQAKEVVATSIDDFVNLEDSMDLTYVKNEDDKYDVTYGTYFNIAEHFTTKGLEIYEENAKDYIIKENEIVDGYTEEKIYFTPKQKYQLGNPNLYRKKEIEIDDIETSKIEATVNLEFLLHEDDSEFEKINEETDIEKYTVKIELLKTGESTWKINNYTITK